MSTMAGHPTEAQDDVATKTTRMRPRKMTGKAGPPAIRNTSVKSRSRLPTKQQQQRQDGCSVGVGLGPISGGTSSRHVTAPAESCFANPTKKFGARMEHGFMPSGLGPTGMLASSTATTTNADGTKKRNKVLKANTVRQCQSWNNPLESAMAGSSSSKRRVTPPRTISDSATAFQPPSMLNGQRSERRVPSNNVSGTSNISASADSDKKVSQLQLMQQSARRGNPTANKRQQPAAKKTPDFSNTVISPTPHQRSLMRQISALGLEDPALEWLKRKPSQGPNNPTLFGYQVDDVPEDVKHFLSENGEPNQNGDVPLEQDAMNQQQQNNSNNQQVPMSPSASKQVISNKSVPSPTSNIRVSSKSLSNNTRTTSSEVTGESPTFDDSPGHHHHPAGNGNSSHMRSQPYGNAKPKKKKTKEHPPIAPMPKSPSSTRRVLKLFSPERRNRRASADMVSQSTEDHAQQQQQQKSPDNTAQRRSRSKTPTRLSNAKRSNSVRRSLRSLFHKDSKGNADAQQPSGRRRARGHSMSHMPAPLHHTSPTKQTSSIHLNANNNTPQNPSDKWQQVEYTEHVSSAKPKKKSTWQGAPTPLYAPPAQ